MRTPLRALWPVNIDRLQHARKLALLGPAVLLLMLAFFLQSHWTAAPLLRKSMVWVGGILIAAAILGRTWAIVYMGRRKRWKFVSDGPYSVARHPLYAFSIMGAAGVAAQTMSFVVTLAAISIVWIIFDRVARVEESDMAARFGDTYRNYLARTPRFLPNPSLWRARCEGVAVDYRLTLRSFCDSSLLAVAVPFYITLRWAHEAGLIPVLFELP